MTGPRYVIEKDDENQTDCHGAELTGYCAAHKVYGDHVRYETLWTVWDNETGTHAPGEPFMFERRKDAIAWLARHLATSPAPAEPRALDKFRRAAVSEEGSRTR